MLQLKRIGILTSGGDCQGLNAAIRGVAKALYEQLVEYTQQQFQNVQTGIFAADMKVHLVNDGPVTFQLEIE